MIRIVKFFDKLEDHLRAKLSRRPVLYSLIGGSALVLFWEGVSIIVEHIPPLNTLWGGIILTLVSLSVALLIGIFVSFFVGDTIIISGVNKEKKITERTEEEIHAEAEMIHDMNRKIAEVDTVVKALKLEVEQHEEHEHKQEKKNEH